MGMRAIQNNKGNIEMNSVNECIEVAGDQWEECQAVIKAMNEQDSAERAACDAIGDIATECAFANVDSCLALQMIDGDVPISELWQTNHITNPVSLKNVEPVCVYL
jgi:cupin superfamily acireductone dioxygenase involved in methionine salvage